MMSKKVIRIIAIVLAALMIIAVFAVALDAFAVEGVLPVTGDNDGVIIAGCIAAVALIASVCCIVLPKLKKKDGKEENG